MFLLGVGCWMIVTCIVCALQWTADDRLSRYTLSFCVGWSMYSDVCDMCSFDMFTEVLHMLYVCYHGSIDPVAVVVRSLYEPCHGPLLLQTLLFKRSSFSTKYSAIRNNS